MLLGASQLTSMEFAFIVVTKTKNEIKINNEDE
jgi:hypothetical protein